MQTSTAAEAAGAPSASHSPQPGLCSTILSLGNSSCDFIEKWLLRSKLGELVGSSRGERGSDRCCLLSTLRSSGHSYLSFPPENTVGTWFIRKAKRPQTPVGRAGYEE